MVVIILFTSNFVAYEKASATATTVNGGAIYTGIVIGATAITAASLHAQQWYEDKKDDLVTLANNTWEYMSTDGKQAFLASLDAYGHGWTVSSEYMSDWFNTLGNEYPIKYNNVELNPKFNNAIETISEAGSGWDRIFILNSNYKFTNGWGRVVITAKAKDGKYALYRIVDYGAGDVRISPYQFTSMNSAYDFLTSISNYVSSNGRHPGALLNYLNSNGANLGLGVVSSVDGSALQLELDGVDFANNWAKNLLNQSETNPRSIPIYANPSLTLDNVYNPADTTIKDVGGVPTAVTQTPTGDWVNTATGEVVIPAEITNPVVPDTTNPDGTIGGFFSLLWQWLKAILQAILNLPLSIINLLKAALVYLFVPDVNFWNNNLNQIKALMWGDEIDDLTNGFSDLSTNSSGGFQSVFVSLMGVSGLKVIDADSINSVLNTVHSWVRGFFYPFLLIFNINMMYRMIRGTSLVGFGRDKGANTE